MKLASKLLHFSSQLIRLCLKVRALADLAAVSYRRKRGEAPGQERGVMRGPRCVKFGTQSLVECCSKNWDLHTLACVSFFWGCCWVIQKAHTNDKRSLDAVFYSSVVFVEEAAAVNEEMTGISLILSFCSKGQPNAGRVWCCQIWKHWTTFLSKFSQVTPYLLYIVDYIFREYYHHWSM